MIIYRVQVKIFNAEGQLVQEGNILRNSNEDRIFYINSFYQCKEVESLEAFEAMATEKALS